MKNMVVGFVFSTDKRYVALIRKEHPDWQKGKWNGIGGHCEIDEGSHEAMVREFREETGLEIIDWKIFAKGFNNNDKAIELTCFKATSSFLSIIKSTTNEEVRIIPVSDLIVYQNLIYNILWLVYLALDDQTTYTVFNFTLNNATQP
jgi:8-oxo-dGTP diphosphatase